MSTGNDRMEVKRIQSAEEDATEDVQPTLVRTDFCFIQFHTTPILETF